MTRVVQIGGATLYQGDCIEIMPSLGQVDHIICDPPYDAEAHTAQRRVLGAGIDRCRAQANQLLPFAALSVEQRDLLVAWGAEKCKGWFVAFCQTESIGAWRSALVSAGCKWRRAGIWVKPDGSPQLSGDRPGQGHEAIAMAWCGDGGSRWNGGGAHGVFTYPKHDLGQWHGGQRNEHPTQKPLRLMNQLIHVFTNVGDVVLDSFMGSGSTGVAAVTQGRRFIGIEVNPDYFAVACGRIAAALSQRQLFV